MTTRRLNFIVNEGTDRALKTLAQRRGVDVATLLREGAAKVLAEAGEVVDTTVVRPGNPRPKQTPQSEN